MDARLSTIAATAYGFVFPSRCAGCGGDGGPICALCRAALIPDVRVRAVAGLTVASGLRYDGAVRHLLLAYKNGGRTDLGGALAVAMRAAVEAAAAGGNDLLVVPMPATSRSKAQRGYEPVRRLLRTARLPVSPILRIAQRREEQAALGRDARLTNLTGTMAARTCDGADIVLVDDVVTTGATLGEAARAVRAAGGRVIGAATLADTPMRSGRPADTSWMP